MIDLQDVSFDLYRINTTVIPEDVGEIKATLRAKAAVYRLLKVELEDLENKVKERQLNLKILSKEYDTLMHRLTEMGHSL